MSDEQSFAAGLVGVVLDGRYRLDALLGEGGMGAVFRAHHLAMDRKVAVKLLKPHLTTDEVALQRFLREARSTLKVESPHAVKVLDFGVTPYQPPERDYYIVLEYLDGRSVQRELDVDGPFAPARAVHIAKQTLRALGAAHRMGLIHRDIKPDNVLLLRVGDDPDYAKVLDFGVAKLMAGTEQSTQSQLALTQAGMVFGTPEFMSPEQACGLELDARSDLYSLAATMFAMLTGCGMYRAGSAIEWLTHHARTPPPHLAEGLPDLARFTELDQVIQQCLAKHREQRPQTADDMIQLLTSIEGTLSRKTGETVGAHTKVARALKSAPSSYFQALPSETLDPNATLPPPSPQAVSRANAPTLIAADAPTTTGTVTTVRGGNRGLWLAAGALAIAGMIAAVIVVASRKQAAVAEPRTGTAGVIKIDAQPAAMVVEAPAADAAVEVPVDAAPIVAPGSGARPKLVMPASSEAAKHLAAAEQAKQAGKNFRQLIEADAALHADPHSVRARFLLGDALLTSGDLARGCKYLRDLGRNSAALARAHSAGCPSN
ncbi:MAG: serine/threonine protein kinase [Myxococcales bacterium]|nr:serine/threonine protein kinase [Myxococcales bacterium]